MDSCHGRFHFNHQQLESSRYRRQSLLEVRLGRQVAAGCGDSSRPCARATHRPDAVIHAGGEGPPPELNMIKRIALAVALAAALTGCASAQLPVCPEIKLTFCPV